MIYPHDCPDHRTQAPDILTEQEGVIKYQLDHEQAKLPHEPGLEKLIAWRSILFDLGLIGQTPARYGGLGYGNVSIRTGKRAFRVSGSQTGGIRSLSQDQFAAILQTWPEQNRIQSVGLIQPSSESMTHAAAYAAHAEIQCVLHVHHHEVWRNADGLGILSTPQNVEYGTVAMAEQVMMILEKEPNQILAMKGHPDGIIASGRSILQAVLPLIKVLVRSEEFLQESPTKPRIMA